MRKVSSRNMYKGPMDKGATHRGTHGSRMGGGDGWGGSGRGK